MKRNNEPIPVIYLQSLKGSGFRNGSTNPTLIFRLDINEDLAAADPLYKEWFESVIGQEIWQAVVNKFIISQPLALTNDKKPYVIFKSNLDEWSLKEFCKAIAEEISFHTKAPHQAQYGCLKTLLLEMNKQPGLLTFQKPGEKLSRMKYEDLELETLESPSDPSDQGIFTPFNLWKETRKTHQENETVKEEEEEVVAW